MKHNYICSIAFGSRNLQASDLPPPSKANLVAVLADSCTILASIRDQQFAAKPASRLLAKFLISLFGREVECRQLLHQASARVNITILSNQRGQSRATYCWDWCVQLFHAKPTVALLCAAKCEPQTPALPAKLAWLYSLRLQIRTYPKLNGIWAQVPVFLLSGLIMGRERIINQLLAITAKAHGGLHSAPTGIMAMPFTDWALLAGPRATVSARQMISQRLQFSSSAFKVHVKAI